MCDRKNVLRINLLENEALAKEHNPEFRRVTDVIDEVYKKVASSHPEFLHPNLKEITLRPWGEGIRFDGRQLGIIIQQW